VHLNWEELLRTYGYAAVLVGTFLEGESILFAGGYAAQQGYLSLPLVILAAFSGSFAGDQMFFTIGRRQGGKILARHPRWQARVLRVHQLMERFHTIFILGFRFLYGLRTLSPFVLGTSDVTHRRFFFLNMIGAGIWAATVATVGYFFGSVLPRVWERVQGYRGPVLVGVLGVVGVIAVVIWRRRVAR
jgi:membrane protein DedA with SNARE-associated domain